MTKKDGLAKEVVVDAGSSLAGLGVGVLIGGPIGGVVGAVVGPTLADVLKRSLSKAEKERIELVTELAILKINQKLKNAKPTKKLPNNKAKELFEGTLLKAKETYETKKLPLLANLFANAPFTNTPFENLNQTLIFAEQLSYQQLCILGLMSNSMVGKDLGLSNKSFSEQYKEKFNERTVGIYQDIAYMKQLGIVAEKDPGANYIRAVLGGGIANIVPNRLIFLHPGLLLFNGLELDSIDKKDLEVVKKALS